MGAGLRTSLSTIMTKLAELAQKGVYLDSGIA